MSRRIILILFTIITLTGSGGCSGTGEGIIPGRTDDADTLNVEVQPGISADSASCIAPVNTSIKDKPRYLDGEVLIVLKDGVAPEGLQPIAEKLKLSLINTIKLSWGSVFRMSIGGGEPVESMVQALLTYPEVRYAEPNLLLYTCSETYYPDDPLFESKLDEDSDPWNSGLDQWGPNVLGASLVWPKTKGSPDVVICVLDTGYRWSHQDLQNSIWINEDEIPDNGIDDDNNGYIDDWRGWDTDQHDNNPWDDYGHGTATSGIVAAEQDNGVGCTGIAPGVKVMAVRCNMYLLAAYTTSVIEGVQYAWDNGATAVSCSFRTYDDSEIMHNTFIAAYDGGNGILPIGGAGNEDSSDLTYPACWPEVVEVGGTCSFSAVTGARIDVRRINFDNFWWGSNWGENLEIMAPGALYITTRSGSDSSYYDGVNNPLFGGTSASTPCVAAGVALIKTVHPEFTALDLRNRLKNTADDLYDAGWDDQSGWGQMNIWRAVYGSEPNSSQYDGNGYVPITTDEIWHYDSLFDVPATDDYDVQDVFTITPLSSGAMEIKADIITTGEDLDFELFDNPGLSGEPIASAIGPNGQDHPTEAIVLQVLQGQTVYLRIFSTGIGNCSTYGIWSDVKPGGWWAKSKSLAPPFVDDGSDKLKLMQLEIHTNLQVTVNLMNAYITGTIPLNLVNNLRLYRDDNNSGTWTWQDTLVGYVQPSLVGVNQIRFEGLSDVATYGDPIRYFILANVGPSNLEYDVTIGAGLRTYQDVGIVEDDIPLGEDPFPLFGNLTVIGHDLDPPVWDSTVGVQLTKPKFQAVDLCWNNATDALSEPTKYNVYWDENFPPQITPEKAFNDVTYQTAWSFDHIGTISGLVNGLTYYFCIRAIDALGNEDTNLVWLSGTPDDTADPANPQVIGEITPPGFAREVWVYESIAYVAEGDGGLAIIDCSDPTSPLLTGVYTTPGCSGVQYNVGQGYVYASCSLGLVIIDPLSQFGPSLVGKYTGLPIATDVCVDGDYCYLGDGEGNFHVLNISNPADPQFGGSTTLGSDAGLSGVASRNGYVFCCTNTMGLRIVDATNPADPHILKTLGLLNNAFEICLYGNYALVTNDQRLYVIDITDPVNASQVGEFNLTGGYGAGVAVRDSQYVYAGRLEMALWTVNWSNPASMQKAGTLFTDGSLGLFFDGTYLYSAEGSAGLKVIL